MRTVRQAYRLFQEVAGEPGGGHPDEVAEAIAWLISDAASYTTGSFLDLAGGR